MKLLIISNNLLFVSGVMNLTVIAIDALLGHKIRRTVRLVIWVSDVQKIFNEIKKKGRVKYIPI
jgi:hypothetical protein